MLVPAAVGDVVLITADPSGSDGACRAVPHQSDL